MIGKCVSLFFIIISVRQSAIFDTSYFELNQSGYRTKQLQLSPLRISLKAGRLSKLKYVLMKHHRQFQIDESCSAFKNFDFPGSIPTKVVIINTFYDHVLSNLGRSKTRI